MQKFSDLFIRVFNAVRHAARGCWILITTENNIKIQMVIALAMTILGFLVNLSTTEWLFQIIAIAIVLVAEALNTAIERLGDFVHPEHHKKMGHIKDIAAGAAFFAAIFAVIIGLIIYIPKIL